MEDIRLVTINSSHLETQYSPGTDDWEAQYHQVNLAKSLPDLQKKAEIKDVKLSFCFDWADFN